MKLAHSGSFASTRVANHNSKAAQGAGKAILTHRTPNQTSLGKQEMRIRANIELVERAGLTQLTRAFEKTRPTEVEPALEHTMINKSHGTPNVQYAKKFEGSKKRTKKSQ